jgi:hypothetical protein
MPREAALACGPSRGATRGVARLKPELGCGSVRPEVGDDRWPPPVSDCKRWAARWAALGRSGCGSGLRARPRQKEMFFSFPFFEIFSCAKINPEISR